MAQRKAHVKTQKKGYLQAKETSEESSLDNTLITEFQPPEL